MITLAFIKMLMIDDLGDKITQLFVGLLAVIIVCIAWWTTSIRDQPQIHTIVLLDRRYRRHSNHNTTHIQPSSTVVTEEESEETSVPEENSTTTETTNSETNQTTEPSTSSDTGEAGSSSNSLDLSPNIDVGLQRIFHIMDADTNVVRLRRLSYYQNQENTNRNIEEVQVSSASEEPITITEQSGTPSIINREERVEIINEPIMEHNYAERDAVFISPTKEKDPESTNATESTITNTENKDSNIRIKLKYLNDELKLVDGRLEEQLGDFKRRHFRPEFSSNKLVRLIFNGQVLQPDTETLQSCGLFDNCVVHCLIHQQQHIHQRNAFNETNSRGGYTNNRSRSRGRLPQGSNNNQGRDWDLGNILFLLVSIILVSAWYFRYEYAHLYTVTATVALVAITVIFTIFLVGIYFPDPAPPEPHIERQQLESFNN